MTDDPSDGTAPLSDRLDGRWAVVTGGSKGIGLGIAEALLGAGANLLLVARGQADLDAAAAGLRDRAGADQDVRTASADTADPASIARLFDEDIAGLPSLDAFVANAGAGRLTPFLEVTAEEWDWCIGLNLTGTFHCIQSAARVMVDGPQDGGAIVVVSSIRGLGARPGVGPYSAAKAGLNQLVRVAAYELAPHGVRVTSLSPGITATPLAARNPEKLAEMAATVPMGRPGSAADMGAAARYLCSPAARFVTGSNLVVDGGEHLW